MKKCEILQELWKCGTNIKWANAIGEVAAIDLLKEELPQTFSLFKKKKKAKQQKTSIYKVKKNEACLYAAGVWYSVCVFCIYIVNCLLKSVL